MTRRTGYLALLVFLFAVALSPNRAYANTVTISGPSSFFVKGTFTVNVGTLFPSSVEVYDSGKFLGNASQQTTSTWSFTYPKVWLGYTDRCPSAPAKCDHPSSFGTRSVYAVAVNGSSRYTSNTVMSTHTGWAGKPVADKDSTGFVSHIATYFDLDSNSGVQKDYTTPKTGWIGYLAAGNYNSVDPHAYDDHRGIDISVLGGNPNQVKLQNVYPGKVYQFVSDYSYQSGKFSPSCGNYIGIEHSPGPDGLATHYTLHCHAKTGSIANAGMYSQKSVYTGDVIGEIGCTGSCGGDHDHFSIMAGGFDRNYAVDPYTEGYMQFLYCDYGQVSCQ